MANGNDARELRIHSWVRRCPARAGQAPSCQAPIESVGARVRGRIEHMPGHRLTNLRAGELAFKGQPINDVAYSVNT